MSFWTNPTKAIASWVRPADAVLKTLLPAPLYTLVKKLLSDEMKLVAMLAQAGAPEVWEGTLTVPQLADRILDAGVTLARSDVLDAARAYTTKTGV